MSRVIHFEIHATDPESLISFYSSLFGWTFQKWEGPMDYWMISTGPSDQPGIDGGLVVRRGDAPSPNQPVTSFVCTINVPSAESSLAQALSLGAELAVPVMSIPSVGYLCYAKDPNGNLFGMMQSDSAAS